MWLQHHIRPGSDPSGPVWMMYQHARLLGLVDVVLASIEAGSFMSMVAWKTLVKIRTSSHDKARWMTSRGMYVSLRLYSDTILDIAMWPWWQFCRLAPSYVRKCQVLLRILVTNRVVNTHALDNDSGYTSSCGLCGRYGSTSAPHVLFECHTQDLTRIREQFWSDLRVVCPHNLVVHMRSLDGNALAAFVLSGFMGTFVPEWIDAYCVVCDFIYNVHMHANHTYNVPI